MTTREDKRFTAAVAAMQGLITQGWSSSVRGNMSIEHVAIEMADQLLARLEETAPPVAEDKKCEHLRVQGRMETVDGGPLEIVGKLTRYPTCMDCGEVFLK